MPREGEYVTIGRSEFIADPGTLTPRTTVPSLLMAPFLELESEV